MLSSCFNDHGPGDGNGPLLGLALNDPSNAWRTQLAAYAQSTAGSYSPYLQHLATQAADAGEQAEQLVMMKGAGVRAVVIVPEGALDAAAVGGLISAGIKVFFCEEKLDVDYTGFVTFSNAEVGEKAGKWLAARPGVVKAACLDISQNQPISDARNDGFRSKLGDIPAVTLECPYYSREAGKAATLAMLADGKYSDVNAIYAQDDEVAFGVLDAIDQTPGSDVTFVIGCGGSKAFFDEISGRTDIALATTLYTPAMIKTSVNQAAVMLISGTEPAQKDTYLPVTVVDASNVATEVPF